MFLHVRPSWQQLAGVKATKALVFTLQGVNKEDIGSQWLLHEHENGRGELAVSLQSIRAGKYLHVRESWNRLGCRDATHDKAMVFMLHDNPNDDGSLWYREETPLFGGFTLRSKRANHMYLHVRLTWGRLKREEATEALLFMLSEKRDDDGSRWYLDERNNNDDDDDDDDASSNNSVSLMTARSDLFLHVRHNFSRLSQNKSTKARVFRLQSVSTDHGNHWYVEHKPGGAIALRNKRTANRYLHVRQCWERLSCDPNSHKKATVFMLHEDSDDEGSLWYMERQRQGGSSDAGGAIRLRSKRASSKFLHVRTSAHALRRHEETKSLVFMLSSEPNNDGSCWYMEKAPSGDGAVILKTKRSNSHHRTNIEVASSTSASIPGPLQNSPQTNNSAMWSISYHQLIQLDEEASKRFGSEYSQMTMRDINTTIIKPRCQETGTSYALYLNPNGLKVDAFITHSWDEPFQDFVHSIRKVFQTSVTVPNLWICAFALYQGDPRTTEAIIGTEYAPLTDSPFVKALEYATSFVVVRNASTDLYSRIWCVCELIFAMKQQLVPDKTHVTGPDVFSKLSTSCLDAKASMPKDRDRILRVLLSEHKPEEIDKMVQRFRTHDTPL